MRLFESHAEKCGGEVDPGGGSDAASCLQIRASSSLSGRPLPLCSNFQKTASCHQSVDNESLGVDIV